MKTGSILFIVLTCTGLALAEPDAPPANTFKLTLDRSLTVFDGPLLPDGRIDYITAMNRRDAAAVAHHNNAFRALLLLIDPKALDEPGLKQYQEMCKLLGVAEQELADSSKFVSWFDFAKKKGLAFDDALEIEGQVVEGGLSHERIAVFKQWLNMQQPAIDAAIVACKLPAYWQPLVESSRHPGSGLIELVPLGGRMRAISRVLKYGVIVALSEGDLQSAANLTITLRRLASYCQQGPFIIDAMIGNIASNSASDAFSRCLKQDNVNSEVIDALSRQWLEVPAPIRYHELALADEMAYALNWYMAIATNHLSLDDDDWMLDLDDSVPLEDVIDRIGIDADALVRRVQMYSKAEAARLNAETYAGYQQLDRAHEKVWGPRKKDFRERYLVEKDEVLRFRFPEGKISPAELAWIVVDLFGVLESDFDFDIDVGRAEFGTLARDVVAGTAAACSRFYIKHGRYPRRLNELVPAYLPKAPIDPIDGQPLRYRLNEDGSAVIYSIYLDREDDGGTTDLEDFEALEEGDYVWRLEPPKKD